MKVLIVEDEARLASLIKRALTEEGHTVEVAGTGEDAISVLTSISLDIVILDVMLPGMNGLDVCRRVRKLKYSVPILLLTAKSSIEDRVEGLDAGADDYLLKPFALAELMARLRALTRRPATVPNAHLEVLNIHLDPIGMYVWKDNEPIALTRKEFGILEYLMKNAGRVVTRDMIANHVWDYDFLNTTNVIDVHIRTLRKKLGDAQPGTLIMTVRGVGYRMPKTIS
ncbi:MAG: response regulator transcription factor [Thermomicrobiales bacterium]|nr:response regulator transcription factor [Thermomicrobiales bacterium]